MTLFAADRLELLLEHLQTELNKLKQLKGKVKKNRKSRRSHRRSAEDLVKATLRGTKKESPKIVKGLKNSIEPADGEGLENQKTNQAIANMHIAEELDLNELQEPGRNNSRRS